MRTSFLVCGGVAIAAALSAAGTAAPVSASAAPPVTLQQGVSRLASAGAPGVLAFVRGPSGASLARAGAGRIGGRRPIGPDDPFRAGSVTKTFVATIVLQLVAEGRLGLDDTVASHLPGLLPRGNVITVRQLLGHTSGLADLGTGRSGEALLERLLADRAHAFRPRELVGSVAGMPLLFRPGQGWSYSNTGYVVLGMLVEKVTGKPLASVVHARITRPLHLGRTRLVSGTALPVGAVHGYLAPGNRLVPTPGGVPVDVSAVSPSWTWAAGALVSSASDLTRFYRALLTGRLLPRRLLDEMTSVRPIAGGASYGLGLLRVRTGCGEAFGHDGEIFGYTTVVLADRDARRTAVVVANVSTPGSGATLAALLELASRALCERS